MYSRFSPRSIYPHPVVEYIPLGVATLAKGEGATPAPRLLPANDEERLGQILAGAGLNPLVTGTVNFQERIAVLAQGLEIEVINYRAHDVIMVGHLTPEHWHLFDLARGYFYRDQLRLTAHAHDGAWLAAASFSLSNDPVSRTGRNHRRGGTGHLRTLRSGG